MIRPKCFLIAQYAAVATNGMLTIAGTFDNIDFRRVETPGDDRPQGIPLQSATLVLVTEASIADGLTHRFRLRVLDGNGQPIIDDTWIDFEYTLNRFGRPLRGNLLMSLNMFVFPGPDDYVFSIDVEGQPGALAEMSFSVTDITDQPVD